MRETGLPCPFPPCSFNLEFDDKNRVYICPSCGWNMKERNLRSIIDKDWTGEYYMTRLGLPHKATFGEEE